jgi:predicted nucleotidyltransferase
VRLLQEVTGTLRDGAVPFALIGAAALAAHGVARASLDLDLLVVDQRVLDLRFWRELSNRAVAVDVRRGDPDDPLAGVVRCGSGTPRPVDVVVGRHGWQRDAIARARRITIEAIELPVVNAVDFVLLKLFAGGTQDELDIRQLLSTRDGEAIAAGVDTALQVLPVSAQQLWNHLRRRS